MRQDRAEPDLRRAKTGHQAPARRTPAIIHAAPLDERRSAIRTSPPEKRTSDPGSRAKKTRPDDRVRGGAGGSA